MVDHQKSIWAAMISSYTKAPRDVRTVPLTGTGIWFYVYAENDDIYIENARNHSISSVLRGRRQLEKEKVDAMLSLYFRRKNGEAVSREATATTQNQVYWYGIFDDMCL